MSSSGASNEQIWLRTNDLDLFRERLLCKEREGTRLGKDRFRYGGECYSVSEHAHADCEIQCSSISTACGSVF